MEHLVRNIYKQKFEDYKTAAIFDFEHINPYVSKLREGALVLEVGCGPGILLDMLSRQYPKICFTGLEPSGDGFGYLDDFLKYFKKRKNSDLIRTDYESFQTDKKFDLIYLVNVFEHLPDWRNFLSFVKKSLNKSGVCIVLCPNYNFPYESHFGLPIIFNKAITYSLFRKVIKDFEKKEDSGGLWKSLNFVKMRQVKKFCDKNDIYVVQDTKILANMIDRLLSDENFYKRHRLLSKPGLFLKNTGLLNMLLKINFVKSYVPYLKLELYICTDSVFA